MNQEEKNQSAADTFGMMLFLASLTMLFLAMMVGYVIIRCTGQYSPPLHTIALPRLLWVSSLVVVCLSIAIQFALIRVRQDRQPCLVRALTFSLLLAIAFMAVQIPALQQLLANHAQVKTSKLHLYGLMFAVVVLHAIHVVGGVIPLVVTLVHARQQRYSALNHSGVKHLVMYWHFLGIAWFALFAMLLILG